MGDAKLDAAWKNEQLKFLEKQQQRQSAAEPNRLFVVLVLNTLHEDTQHAPCSPCCLSRGCYIHSALCLVSERRDKMPEIWRQCLTLSPHVAFYVNATVLSPPKSRRRRSRSSIHGHLCETQISFSGPLRTWRRSCRLPSIAMPTSIQGFSLSHITRYTYVHTCMHTYMKYGAKKY
jgi:hypothetical protein